MKTGSARMGVEAKQPAPFALSSLGEKNSYFFAFPTCKTEKSSLIL